MSPTWQGRDELSASSLTPGRDYHGEIFYLDGTLNDLASRAVTFLNEVYMHEMEYNIARKHARLPRQGNRGSPQPLRSLSGWKFSVTRRSAATGTPLHLKAT